MSDGLMDILDAPEKMITPPEYAGFWLRLVAAFIDGILLSIVNYGLAFLMLGTIMPDFENSNGAILIVYYIVTIGITLGYHSYFESSDKQASLGKQALGIVVTDEHGERLTPMNALGRNVGKYLSGIILLIGYMMAGFTEKKQALHDIMAKALVVMDRR